MLTSTYINTIWLRNRVVDVVRSRARDDRGAVLVEYALLFALIFLVCLAGMTLLGTNTHDSVTNTADKVQAAN